MRTCSIAGCRGRHYARGLCSKHYQRESKTGDAMIRSRRRTKLDWLCDAIGHAGDDCIDWPFAARRGYGAIRVDGSTLGAYRVACELAHGPAPEGDYEAAHSCGRPICVNPNHLRWATPAENQADRVEHGTHCRGERYGAHKLTESAVREIRRLVAAGARQKDVAPQFGISAVTVSDVVRGKSWGWLS